MEFIRDNEIVPSSSYQSEEGVRSCRIKKKQTDPTCCPVCSVTIRDTEVDIHLNSEIEKLNKIPSPKYKVNAKNNPSSSSDNNTDKNWETFQKVRFNRQSRHRSKTRKRRAEETCPICGEEVSDDLVVHVEKCLRREEEASSNESDENIDVEAFEEYEWAGQSRIRATTLLQGSVSNLGTSITMSEEDEVLNVDVDDTQRYGSPQYYEKDVIPSCDSPDNFALRKAVTGNTPKKLCIRADIDCVNTEHKSGTDPIVEVLKKKIRELEDKNKEDVFKCLICMERYRVPVISVCCWHVHCEECWLMTLGAKKLCPQCNMITSPVDLRKIYM